MKRAFLLSVVLLAATALTPAKAQVVVDPLHGEVCAGGNGTCTNVGDNGTNTPIQQGTGGTVQTFGFAASPAATGTLTLDILVPSTTLLSSFPATDLVSGSGITGNASVTLFTTGFGQTGLNLWTSGGIQGNDPTLAAFLQNGTTEPDMNLGAYLPSTRALEASLGQSLATGFYVFQLTGLGPFDIPNPDSSNPGVQTLPDVFNLNSSLPIGSYIVASLVGTQDSNGHMIDIGTANSAALFVTPASAVPEPQTWAMMLLGFVGLGFAFRQSRRKVSFA